MDVVYYVAASIDGYIARRDGSVDWLENVESSTTEYGYSEFYRRVDALVMGRRTYDLVARMGHWPYEDRPSFVMTSRPPDLLPHNGKAIRTETESLQEGASAACRTLSEAGYRRIWLVGGGTVAGSFLAAGHLDELIVTVIPVVLGTGIPLFDTRDVEEPGLESLFSLLDTRTYDTGVVQMHYRRRRDHQASV